MRLHDLLRRAPTIRQWLAMLLAAVIVPAAAAVVALFVHSYERERTGIERATLDVSRALMQAIDRELASAQGAMQALATSPNLDRADLRAFYGQATEVLHERPGNILLLADRHGRQVVNTHLPFGAPLPMHGNLIQLQRVVASARPLVSDVYVGPTVQRLLTSVDVPVVRKGEVLYVLSMQYFGERLGAILERQNIPPEAIAIIYDSSAHIVWRSRGSRGDVGQRAWPALATGLARNPEGIVDEAGPDGAPYVTVFSRSSVSNWAVAIALRRGALNMTLWRSLAWIALGTLALFGLGLALVRAVGSRIERSIRGLVHPAIALGYGEPVALPALHLREAKDVGHALLQAAALLRERTGQRDEAERAERRLRDANRAIERSEAFLRGIFEQTPDGVFLVGPDCRVTRANAQAERLFCYPQGALAGLPIDDLLYETGPAACTVCERVRTAPLRRGADGATRLHGRRRDGASFPADAMASPLRERSLVILTVRDVTENWEREEAVRGALDDKNILLKELYHRVKNNLQLIISMFSLQIRSLPEGQARQALHEAAGRVRTMALVHERLYQSRTLSSIALDDYVAELCAQLAGAASAPQRGITVQVEAEPVEIGLDVAVPFGLLVSELVSNSLKHGFPDGRHGHILVRIVRGEGDNRCLTVSDDGVGLPPGFDRTSVQTLGLKLVTALSDQLRARFSIENLPIENLSLEDISSGNLSTGNRGGALATLVFQVPHTVAAPAHRHEAAVPD
jgi:PAS domain S-box-containing protein